MRNLLTWILAGLSMTGALAIDMYLPSFHGIGASFGASPALVQQTLSAFLFAFAFMMLFSGTLSDSFGRRPVILGSVALYGAASFGAAFAPSMGWLLACRVLQGLAAGASTVVSRAVIENCLFVGNVANLGIDYVGMLGGSEYHAENGSGALTSF